MRKNIKRKRQDNLSIKSGFLKAVIDNDITWVEDALKELDINSFIDSKMTALHYAIKAHNTEMINFLLSRGAEVDIGDINGITPLHLAVAEGNLEIATILLNAGANINEIDFDRFSPLHVSAQYNYVDLVKLLIERGANPYLEDVEGVTALHLALYNNNIDVASILINVMDRKFVEQNIGLHTAARSGHNEMVKLLLSFFSDINALSFTSMNRQGVTALSIAVDDGLIETARFLIENGALFSEPSGYDEISTAIQNEDIEMVKLLIEKGVGVNQIDEKGVSLLHIAINNLDLDLVSLLIYSGTDLNQFYKNKIPPLQLAIRVYSFEISKFLLENGADPNQLDSRGFTSLHLAASKGYIDIVSLLLGYNSHIEYLNNQGITALRIASLREHYDVVNLLIENGANIYDNNNLAFGELLEDSKTVYNSLYNTYIATRNFYNQNLRIDDKKFISSDNFCEVYVNNLISEMIRTNVHAREVFEYATNDLPVFKELKNIVPLLDKIISFLTISELKKIITSYTNELNEMIQILNFDSYSVQDVEKDGNCFFRAAAIAINQQESSHEALRLRTARHISDNHEEFRNFSENLDLYISDLEQPGTWADNIAIQAFADEFNVNINIIRTYPDESVTQITPRNNAAENTIRLIYTGNHYMATVQNIDQVIHEQDLNPDTNFTEESLENNPLIIIQDEITQETASSCIEYAGMTLFDK